MRRILRSAFALLPLMLAPTHADADYIDDGAIIYSGIYDPSQQLFQWNNFGPSPYDLPSPSTVTITHFDGPYEDEEGEYYWKYIWYGTLHNEDELSFTYSYSPSNPNVSIVR